MRKNVEKEYSLKSIKIGDWVKTAGKGEQRSVSYNFLVNSDIIRKHVYQSGMCLGGRRRKRSICFWL